MPEIQGYTQHQLLQALNADVDARQAWGAVYSHRQACVRYLRDTVIEWFEDPAMTRRRLRENLDAIAKQIEEHGPLTLQEFKRMTHPR